VCVACVAGQITIIFLPLFTSLCPCLCTIFSHAQLAELSQRPLGSFFLYEDQSVPEKVSCTLFYVRTASHVEQIEVSRVPGGVALSGDRLVFESFSDLLRHYTANVCALLQVSLRQA
jgi:hypothetical protein